MGRHGGRAKWESVVNDPGYGKMTCQLGSRIGENYFVAALCLRAGLHTRRCAPPAGMVPWRPPY